MMPLLLLAESGTSFTAGQLAAFLGIVAFLLGLVLLSRKVFGHDPALHKEYVSRADHEKLERELKADLAKQAGARKGIYEKIEAQGRDIASLKSETTSQTRQLSTMDAKIDRLLERHSS